MSLKYPIVSLFAATGAAVWHSHYIEGVSPKDVIGRVIWEVVPETEREKLKSVFAKVVYFQEPATYWTHHSGIPFFVSAMPVNDVEGVACCTKALPARKGHDTLTSKELKVFSMLGEGHEVATIAESMFVAVSTVQAHIANIRTKLGLARQAQVVAYAAPFVQGTTILDFRIN